MARLLGLFAFRVGARSIRTRLDGSAYIVVGSAIVLGSALAAKAERRHGGEPNSPP